MTLSFIALLPSSGDLLSTNSTETGFNVFALNIMNLFTEDLYAEFR
jgi:hypothetical protein